MESLRAELARAKEQARKSDAAAEKALEELRAEQAAHCRSKKERADMAVNLKSAADRCGTDGIREGRCRCQGCSLYDESCEGGAASGWRDRSWKALYAAEEVL